MYATDLSRREQEYYTSQRSMFEAPDTSIPVECLLYNGKQQDYIKTKYELPNTANTLGKSTFMFLVAGNSGMPGGAVGLFYINKQTEPLSKLFDMKYATQEEDILQYFLMQNKGLTRYSSLLEPLLGKRDDPNAKPAYGFERGDSKGHTTVNGKDYRYLPKKESGKGSRYYAELKRLSEQDKGDGFVTSFFPEENFNLKPSTRMYGESWTMEAPNLVGGASRSYLTFVAGPNVNKEVAEKKKKTGNTGSTTLRTFNEDVEKSTCLFYESLYWTFKAGLMGMIVNAKDGTGNITKPIALLCHVSGGLYAGKNNYKKEGSYTPRKCKELVDRILGEEIRKGVRIGDQFERVILCIPNSAYLPGSVLGKRSRGISRMEDALLSWKGRRNM